MTAQMACASNEQQEEYILRELAIAQNEARYWNRRVDAIKAELAEIRALGPQNSRSLRF